jgi:hypothetical protein
MSKYVVTFYGGPKDGAVETLDTPWLEEITPDGDHYIMEKERNWVSQETCALKAHHWKRHLPKKKG